MGQRRCLEVRLGTTFSLKGLSTMSNSNHHQDSVALALGSSSDTLWSKPSHYNECHLLPPESPLPSVRPTSVLRFGHEEFRADSHSVSGIRASWNHRCNFLLPANQNEYPKELQVEIWDSATLPSRLLSCRAVDVSAVYDASRGSSMDALESLQGADGKTAGQIRLHVQLLQEDSSEDPTLASPPPLPPPQLVPATPLSSQRGARTHASVAGRRNSHGGSRAARKSQGMKSGRQQAQKSETTPGDQPMPHINAAAESVRNCPTGQQPGQAEQQQQQQQQMWLKPQTSQNESPPSPVKPLRLTLPPIFSNFLPVSSSTHSQTTNVATPRASLLALPFGSAGATTIRSPPSERTESPFSANPIASQSRLPPSSLTTSPAASRSPSPSPPPASASPSPSPLPNLDIAVTPNSSPSKTTLAPSPAARVIQVPSLTDLLAAKPLPPLSLPGPRALCGRAPEDSDAESDEEALLTELRLGLGSSSRFERQTTAPSPFARGPEIDFLGSPSRERGSQTSAGDNAHRSARVGAATSNGVSDAAVGAALAVNRWDSAAIGQLTMDFLASEDDGSSSPTVKATIPGLNKSQSFGCKARSDHAATAAAAASSKSEPKLQYQGSFGRSASLVVGIAGARAVEPSEALAPSPPARCPKPGLVSRSDKRATSKALLPAPFRGQEGALQALKRAASESILFRGGPTDTASTFSGAPVPAAPWISEAEIGAMVVQALKRQRRDGLMRAGHGVTDMLQGLF